MSQDNVEQLSVCIIGAGPAGLTAAYELSRHHIPGIILEADSVVGGISRTVIKDGYRFDIGGHRFFSKVSAIETLWNEMLGEPLLNVPRQTRIYYDNKFYDYPLRAMNALSNMGLGTAMACMASYAHARINPIPNPVSFEQWITNQFGSRLYRMFFKTYTEKVWGMPCSQIGADWAAQRIKGLSLAEAVRNALFGAKKGKTVKTLIDEFRYPRYGPGQLWESCARKVQANGWDLRLNTSARQFIVENKTITRVLAVDRNGQQQDIKPDYVCSSMPLGELIRGMTPSPPQAVVDAANSLKYRDHMVVALIIDQSDLWPDNWIYIHSPEVKVGRIQNYNNWGPGMVPDSSTTCLGMEYFVNKGDEYWCMPDDELIQLAYSELKQLKLTSAALIKGYVIRMPKAYPVYDTGYADRLQCIRDWLTAEVKNLYCLGRNGQHRYNNQDHSMATALIAAQNIATGDTRDPWSVNEDAEYHEIVTTERAIPSAIPATHASS